MCGCARGRLSSERQLLFSPQSTDFSQIEQSANIFSPRFSVLLVKHNITGPCLWLFVVFHSLTKRRICLKRVCFYPQKSNMGDTSHRFGQEAKPNMANHLPHWSHLIRTYCRRKHDHHQSTFPVERGGTQSCRKPQECTIAANLHFQWKASDSSHFSDPCLPLIHYYASANTYRRIHTNTRQSINTNTLAHSHMDAVAPCLDT